MIVIRPIIDRLILIVLDFFLESEGSNPGGAKLVLRLDLN